MKCFILSLVCASLAATSLARLGEDPAQCGRRYGTIVLRRDMAGQRGYENVYVRGPYRIIVRFVPTVRTSFQGYEAGYLQFRRRDDKPINEETALILLEKNRRNPILTAQLGQNIQWEEEDSQDPNITKEWRRVFFYDQRIGSRLAQQKDCAGAKASLSRDGVLTITSHFDLPEGYPTRAERREVEGEDYDPPPILTEDPPSMRRRRNL